jgi:hypothetical protein
VKPILIRTFENITLRYDSRCMNCRERILRQNRAWRGQGRGKMLCTPCHTEIIEQLYPSTCSWALTIVHVTMSPMMLTKHRLAAVRCGKARVFRQDEYVCERAKDHTGFYSKLLDANTVADWLDAEEQAVSAEVP